MKKILLLLLLTLSYNVYAQDICYGFNDGKDNKTKLIILPDSTLCTFILPEGCLKYFDCNYLIGDTVKIIFTCNLNNSFDVKNTRYHKAITIKHGTWIIKEIKDGKFIFR